MTYPPYIREKARQLRRDDELTIDEIAERLDVSRTTVFGWVRDLPRPARCVKRPGGNAWPDSARRKGTRAMQARYRREREEAYELGHWEYPRLARLPLFRDFVCLYIAEGFKRTRHSVSVANSDPAAIALALHWIRRFSRKAPTFSIQYHADQRLEELQALWATQLGIPDMTIRFQRKTNSGRLGRRTWRCKHGVLTVGVNDTLFRARLQGWIDRMRDQWLDSIRAVGA